MRWQFIKTWKAFKDPFADIADLSEYRSRFTEEARRARYREWFLKLKRDYIKKKILSNRKKANDSILAPLLAQMKRNKGVPKK